LAWLAQILKGVGLPTSKAKLRKIIPESSDVMGSSKSVLLLINRQQIPNTQNGTAKAARVYQVSTSAQDRQTNLN